MSQYKEHGTLDSSRYLFITDRSVLNIEINRIHYWYSGILEQRSRQECKHIEDPQKEIRINHRQEIETVDTDWDPKHVKKPQTQVGIQAQIRNTDRERNHTQTENADTYGNIDTDRNHRYKEEHTQGQKPQNSKEPQTHIGSQTQIRAIETDRNIDTDNNNRQR